MWSDTVPAAQVMRVAAKKAKMAAVSTGIAIAVLQALAFGTLALGCSSGGNHLAGTGDHGGTGCSPAANPGAYVPGCQ